MSKESTLASMETEKNSPPGIYILRIIFCVLWAAGMTFLTKWAMVDLFPILPEPDGWELFILFSLYYQLLLLGTKDK